MAYFVYVLACYKGRNFSCYYVGQTNDLRARMAEHIEAVRNHDTRTFTGRFDFVEKVWHRTVPSRVDALRLESFLKSLTPESKEKYMEEH